MQKETQRFLVAADIGGTSCRVALFLLEDGALILGEEHIIQTRSIHTSGEWVAGMRQILGKSFPEHPVAVVAGVAGPIAGGRARLSNADLVLDEAEIARSLGCAVPVRLVNDFRAVAAALLTPVAGQAETVVAAQSSSSCPRPVLGVVGAGTGFGCAAVIAGKEPAILSSEGGHMAFPFRDDTFEQAYHRFLCDRWHLPYAEIETVVSGRGLEALYAFVMHEERGAADIAGLCFQDAANPVLYHFSRFYGRACQSWMLATLCRGGLWIAGGIAAKNPVLVKGEAFRTEIAKGAHATLLSSIPVRLIQDESCGLWGAARLAWDLAVGNGTLF